MRETHVFPDGTQLDWRPELVAAIILGHSLTVDCHCMPWCLTDTEAGEKSVCHVAESLE